VGLRLLLVDDHDALRRFLCRTLIAEGLEVIEAEGGDQAWKLLESGTVVDAILTDIVMPEGGGMELARRVRDSGRGLHVIFMTGFAADEVEEATREFPELQMLRKPFQASDVVQALSGISEVS
jgi:CheY-like chemotaxis protein